MLTDVVRFLRDHDNFLLIAHVAPDGDTLGSCLALQQLLRHLGKAARVVCDDPVPHLYAFLPGADQILTADAPVEAAAFVAVDCADTGRTGSQWDRVGTRPSLCIDHHVPEAGMCLYTAIATDTGNFAYSNVTPRTFTLMGKVMESGFDLPEGNRFLYRNQRLQKLRMTARTVENARLYRDEQVIVGTLSKAETEAVGGLNSDAEGLIDSLRDVETVLVACFLREEGENEVKLSLRAKDRVDCAAIAKVYGGGGHVRAAGATLHMSLREAEEEVTRKLLAAFDTL